MHILSCGECRKQYDEMKAELPAESRTEFEEEQKQFTDALKAVRKKRMKRRVRMTALTALICAAAVLIGLFAYDALFRKMTVPVDNSLYSLSICETKDGRYVITADAGRISFSTDTYSEDVYEDGRDIVYLRFTAAPVHTDDSTVYKDRKWAMMIMGNDGEETADEIRQGTPGSYLTVWKKGDPIPAASDEMERYFALEATYRQWFETLPETEKGVEIPDEAFFAWQDGLEEARQAVPEWK